MDTSSLFEISLNQSELPLWSKDMRGFPNALARSALFNVSHVRSGERQAFKLCEIATTKGIRLVYTGEELRQDDEDVLMQVLHLAKEQKLGDDIRFTANSMLTGMGWTVNSGSYARLAACMNRMKATALELSVQDNHGGMLTYTGSLVGDFMRYERGTDDPLAQWVVSLPKTIVRLFDPDAFSLINWNTRKELSPLAKWLHTFYSTHKAPYNHKVETLLKLTGSKSRAVRQFRYELKSALAALVDNGFFLSAHIDPKSDLVNVERAADRKRLE